MRDEGQLSAHQTRPTTEPGPEGSGVLPSGDPQEGGRQPSLPACAPLSWSQCCQLRGKVTPIPWPASVAPRKKSSGALVSTRGEQRDSGAGAQRLERAQFGELMGGGT